MRPILHSTLLSTLALLIPIGCVSTRPSASSVASAKEAAARSATALPPVSYGLEVSGPGGAEEELAIPWFEVRGRSGRADLFEADIVLAIDLSLSSLYPSGADLDEDGVIGELRGVARDAEVSPGQQTEIPAGRFGGYGAEIADLSGATIRSGNAWKVNPRNWTTDSDDTVAEAQFLAARILISGLGPRRNRIGLVTYTRKARVREKLGPPEKSLEAIDKVRVTGASPTTSVAAALRQARRLLTHDEEDADARRQKAVLLFTDGRPTFPAGEDIARIQALYAADDLAKERIDLYVFTFGKIGIDQARFLLELAGSAKGRLFRVTDPHRLLEDLPPVDLAPRWIEIENTTTGQTAQGLRVARDGRFDAFVPLAPGDNQVRVLAELGDGRLQRWEQTVRFDPPEQPSEEERLAAERVEVELRARAEDESDAAAAAAPDGR